MIFSDDTKSRIVSECCNPLEIHPADPDVYRVLLDLDHNVAGAIDRAINIAIHLAVVEELQ